MKAYDANLDSGIRDRGFDFLMSRSFSKDVDGAMDYHRYKMLQERREGRLGAAQNYFAMACPIMPLGILGAFLLLGKLDEWYENSRPLSAREQLLMNRQRDDVMRAMYVAAMREKMEKERRKGMDKGAALCSKPPQEVVVKTKDSTKSKAPNSDKAPASVKAPSFSGSSLLLRDQRNSRTVLKKKIELQSEMEDFLHSQDYSSVCRVSARIELLDKALKRMTS